MISLETLKFYPLFAHQDASMLEQIAMLAEVKEVKSGHQLFFEGEVAKQFFLILDGSVILTMNMGDKENQKIEEQADGYFADHVFFSRQNQQENILACHNSISHWFCYSRFDDSICK